MAQIRIQSGPSGSHCARDEVTPALSPPRPKSESVPRLPTFPARWALGDPRRRPDFVFRTNEYDGELEYCLKMAPTEDGATVLVTAEGGEVY